MRPGAAAATTLIALGLLGARAPAGVAATSDPEARVIVAIGDSITFGTTRSGPPGGGPAAARRDPEGGYPGRLAAELGPTVSVRNRGAGGSGTRFWLDAPGLEPAALERFARALWPDFAAPTSAPPAMPAPDGANLLSLVLAHDRPAVVLLLVGVNDVAESGPGRPPVDPAAIAERIARLAAQARAAGAQVIVSTLLPNRRDPAPTIAEVNRRICAAERDCLRLDRAWESAGGDDLLGDEIHPSERGHAVIAAAFLDALRTRGLVPAAAAPARVPAPAPSPSAAHAAGGSASPDAGVAP